MTEEYLGITIDKNRDKLFDELGRKRLEESYLKPGETSPQHRYAYVAKVFGSDKEHKQRLYDYMSKHWLSPATPILTYDENKKGLPISCFLNYIEDTAESLVDKLSETNYLSMAGGGVGIGFGIRAKDEKSTGVMSHMKIYDASVMAYQQGRTRRGSYAAYLDISHPDIIQFLEMRKPTGDQNIRCLNMHHGINITDDFMQIIENCMVDPNASDEWNLVDPHDRTVRETVSAKEVWQRILEMRMQTGEPYLHFIDASNRALPDHLKEKGLKIRQSNLCSEIILPTTGDRTAVCCLSSVNLEYYDSWKSDPLFLQDIAEMLDNVLTKFINTAPKPLKNAIYSAKQERSIGIGALGFHAYLQKHNIPFESALAKSHNMRMFKHISSELNNANLTLGKKLGEAPDAKGTGKRFSHMMAIAPNASTSIIVGNTSPSIEPYRACAYTQKTLSGTFTAKNKFLDKLIKKKVEADPKLDYDEIWSEVIANEGSCQTLDILTDDEKDVFKTSMEIDQRWVIEHASDRQPFIDQAQSLNVFFRPNTNIKYLHAVHFGAWKHGLKTMYYCRSEKLKKADKIAKKIERKVIDEINMQDLVDNGNCLACEG